MDDPCPAARPAAAPGRARPAAALPLLLGLLLLGLLLGLQLLEPLFFLRDDNADQFLPAYLHAYESLAERHELPLLDQHQAMGGTFLASAQNGVFLGPMYALLASIRALGGDARLLIDALATLHLLLAGLGMWLLLRHLGCRPAFAFPLALCWACLPFGVVVGRSWIFVTYLMAFLPCDFWLLLRYLNRPTAGRLALLAAAKLYFLFGGYVQLLLFASLCEFVFLGLRAWLERPSRRWRLEFPALAAAFALTGLLGAPLILPLLAAKGVSAIRAQSLPASVALERSLDLPDFLGAQVFLPRIGYFERYGSTAIFFLGAPLLLGLALALRRRRQLGPTCAAALGAGLLALLLSSPLYWLLYQLPLFDSLRWPFKHFPVAAFFFFLAAARAAAWWSTERPERERRRVAVAAALCWLNLAMQLVCLLPAAWRSPFGPYRLDQTVEAWRQSPLLAAIPTDGRVIALRAGGDAETQGDPLRLGFLYATLAGKYQVQGYDPLMAEVNHRLTFRSDNDLEVRIEPRYWEELRRRFDRLSARYLLVAEESRLLPALAASPGLRRRFHGQGQVLLENMGADPLAYLQHEPPGTRRPLPFRWRTNGMDLDLPADFPGGRVVFNLAALPGYSVRRGAAEAQPEVCDARPCIDLPPGAAKVELIYRDSAFRYGLWAAAAGLLLLALLFAGEAPLRRRLDRLDSGQDPSTKG